MKTIAEFKRAMVIGSKWNVSLMWKNGNVWLPTKEIKEGTCVRVSTQRFTIYNGIEDLNVDFPLKENFHSRGADKIEISTTKIKKFKLIISKSN